MPKNRAASPSSGQLEKKLAAYTLAGAAALAAPAVAKADIVFVNVGQTINQGESISFPFADDVTVDAQQDIVTNPDLSLETVNWVNSFIGSGTKILNDVTDGQVAALAFGALIDPTLVDPTNPAANWGNGGKLASSKIGDPGNWPLDGGHAYLGFYFGGPVNPQAGWADIATTANTTTSSFQLLSYAYETDPNVAITAGEGTPAVPEPSALPLLILGGAGLIALRRRAAN